MNAVPETNNLELLNSAEVLVSKIGGDNAPLLAQNYTNVRKRLERGQKTILVVSAMRSSDAKYSELRHPEVIDRDSSGEIKPGFNTTSHLKKIGEFLNAKNIVEAKNIYASVSDFLVNLIMEALQDESATISSKVLASLKDCLSAFGAELEAFDPEQDKILMLDKDNLIQKSDGKLISLTGFGETVSKIVYERYFSLKELDTATSNVDGAFEAVFQGNDPVQILADVGENSAAQERLRAQISSDISDVIDDNEVIVLGGYAPLIASERGYTEKMGARTTVVVKEIGKKVAYLIEKVFPIMSADPRKLGTDRTQVVQHMGWDLAKETFGVNFGADGGAVQAEALDILEDGGVEAFVCDPEYITSDRITRIFDHQPGPNGIEMVQARQAASVIQIKSSAMNTPGFTARIGSWFQERNISYDHSATSETTMTFAFGKYEFTEEDEAALKEEMGEGFDTRVEKDITLLFCLGNNMGHVGPMHRATTGLKMAGVSTRLVTQGINERVMIFGIDHDQLDAALDRVHWWGVELSDDRYADYLNLTKDFEKRQKVV